MSTTDVSVDVARLYVALGRVTRVVRRDAPASAVGHGALSALATLAHLGPQRLGALAAGEGVSPPSMTRIVASLEESGYVRRSPDPDDRRAAVVEVTDSGRGLVVGRKNDKLAALEARLARLDPAARAALDAALPALEQLSQG